MLLRVVRTYRSSSPAAIKTETETLWKKLLSLAYAKRSAETFLSHLKNEGRSIGASELRQAILHLRSHKRYKHALEVCEWMAKQKCYKLLSGDYAVHLDLIAKYHNIVRAEKFFEDIPKAYHGVYSVLLHHYVKYNMVTKAEAFMELIKESGLVKNPYPYNHMLSLYIANEQLEKVPGVIRDLKRNTLPDVVTYNMWLKSCVKQNDVEAAVKVFSELKEAGLSPDWVTYSFLAELYTKNGLDEKAMDALNEMEKFARRKNRPVYSSLVSLRGNVGDKNGVREVWKKMKMAFHTLNDDEYLSVISSLVKLDELKEAEDLYNEWVSVSPSKSDARASNVLIAAYIKRDEAETAIKFYKRITLNGMKINFITLELLARGYSKLKNSKKALHYFKAVWVRVPNWAPNEKTISEVFEAIEEEGNIEGAEELLDVLREARCLTTEIYKSVLRTYVKAGKMPLLVKERMNKDKIQIDKETRDLIKTSRKLCASVVMSKFLRR